MHTLSIINGMISKALSTLKLYNFMKKNGSSLPRPIGLDWLLKKLANLFQHISFPLLSTSPQSSVSNTLSVVSIPGPSYLQSPQPRTPSPIFTWLAPSFHSGQFQCHCLREHSSCHHLTCSFHPIVSVIAP